jgi:hypothetical protein
VELGYLSWYSDQATSLTPSVLFLSEARDFSLRYSFQNDSVVNPASTLISTRVCFHWSRVVGGEVNHSPPSDGEVKNGVLMAWCSIN